MANSSTLLSRKGKENTNNKVDLKHIAIIMDGNRRWARKYGLSVDEGHKKGAETLERLLKHLVKKRIGVLTVYAFSTENWKRDKMQINFLFSLMARFIKEKEKDLMDNDVVLRAIGDLDRFPKKLKEGILDLIEKTKKNTGSVLNVALSYGGRDEILRAFNKALKNKQEELTEKDMDKLLDTKGLDDPDLIIRTGGAKRLSNFLLWQSSYSELFFTNTLWPDFQPREMDGIIDEFYSRKRNFGK